MKLQTMIFRLITTIIFCLPGIFVINQSSAEPFNVIIHSEQWDIPRHGETLIKQPELAKNSSFMGVRFE